MSGRTFKKMSREELESEITQAREYIAGLQTEGDSEAELTRERKRLDSLLMVYETKYGVPTP